jgi:hypothetical protein
MHEGELDIEFSHALQKGLRYFESELLSLHWWNCFPNVSYRNMNVNMDRRQLLLRAVERRFGNEPCSKFRRISTEPFEQNSYKSYPVVAPDILYHIAQYFDDALDVIRLSHCNMYFFDILRNKNKLCKNKIVNCDEKMNVKKIMELLAKLDQSSDCPFGIVIRDRKNLQFSFSGCISRDLTISLENCIITLTELRNIGVHFDGVALHNCKILRKNYNQPWGDSKRRATKI